MDCSLGVPPTIQSNDPQQVVGEAKSCKSEDVFNPIREGSTTRSTKWGGGGSDGWRSIHAKDLYEIEELRSR